MLKDLRKQNKAACAVIPNILLYPCHRVDVDFILIHSGYSFLYTVLFIVCLFSVYKLIQNRDHHYEHVYYMLCI